MRANAKISTTMFAVSTGEAYFDVGFQLIRGHAKIRENREYGLHVEERVVGWSIQSCGES